MAHNGTDGQDGERVHVIGVMEELTVKDVLLLAALQPFISDDADAEDASPRSSVASFPSEYGPPRGRQHTSSPRRAESYDAFPSPTGLPPLDIPVNTDWLQSMGSGAGSLLFQETAGSDDGFPSETEPDPLKTSGKDGKSQKDREDATAQLAPESDEFPSLTELAPPPELAIEASAFVRFPSETPMAPGSPMDVMSDGELERLSSAQAPFGTGSDQGETESDRGTNAQSIYFLDLTEILGWPAFGYRTPVIPIVTGYIPGAQSRNRYRIPQPLCQPFDRRERDGHLLAVAVQDIPVRYLKSGMTTISSNALQPTVVPVAHQLALRGESDATAYMDTVAELSMVHSQHVEFIREMMQQLDIIIQWADDDLQFTDHANSELMDP